MSYDRAAIVAYAAAHPELNQTQVAKVFGCAQNTVSRICIQHGQHAKRGRRFGWRKFKPEDNTADVLAARRALAARHTGPFCEQVLSASNDYAYCSMPAAYVNGLARCKRHQI